MDWIVRMPKILKLLIQSNIFNFCRISVKRSSEDLDESGISNGSSTQSGPIVKRSVHCDIRNDSGIEDHESVDAYVTHKNQPVLTDVYLDPETEKEIDVIMATLYGGATDVQFSLVGSGPGTSTAKITYNWPPLSFEIEDLFEKPIKSEKLPTCHPKILALKKGLQNCRGAIDETPRGSIELNFPIPVQTAENSILRNGKKTRMGLLF